MTSDRKNWHFSGFSFKPAVRIRSNTVLNLSMCSSNVLLDITTSSNYIRQICHCKPCRASQDCLDAVSGSTLFTTVDMTSGYHQVPVKKSDIPKTAFVTKYGLYEFTKMPMGLKSAPMTFQRVMELALQGLQWQICLIYLDDVVIFSKTFDEHIERLSTVLISSNDCLQTSDQIKSTLFLVNWTIGRTICEKSFTNRR
jgi:hypothetical protein